MKPKKQKTKVSKKKIATVDEITNLIKNKKTVLIASIRNLPASQFQEIGKKLRNKAIIKVPRKNLMLKAIENSKNEELIKLKDNINEGTAILFSDLDSFELASILLDNKSPARAKAGQEAPLDIEVPAGPTDLVPGPAISELGSLGIQIMIEKGKITIKEAKVIAKHGEKISQAAVEIMNKLDIKPFSIGFIPLSAFDTQDKKLYLEITIDKAGTLEKLKNDFTKALAFAVEMGYPCQDTIKLLIMKAASHEKAIEIVSTKNSSGGNENA